MELVTNITVKPKKEEILIRMGYPSEKNVKNKKMHLAFISGNAQAELNEKMEIKETKENIKIKGCLAILSL